MPDISAEDYREALSRFPSGVTVVVTEDHTGTPRGFTASAFTAVSQDPPLVLVCLTKSADSYPAFVATGKFAIHFAADENTPVALRFATKGADKFAGDDFVSHTDGLCAAPSHDCRVRPTPATTAVTTTSSSAASRESNSATR